MARKNEVKKKAPARRARAAARGAVQRRKALARGARAAGRSGPAMQDRFDDIVMARELFWNNVIREILTALSMLALAGADAQSEGVDVSAVPEGSSPTDPLDGRLAILVSTGERIPIAEVYPLFACGVPGSESERALSVAVECTVFQIRTPAGEVYTLPLHEIRGFHALTQDLMNQLSQAAAGASTSSGEPFGFAAFTELSRSRAGSARSEEAPPEIADSSRVAAGAD